MDKNAPAITINGFKVYSAALDMPQQRRLIEDLRRIVKAAPFFQPKTPMGRPMSVQISACGDYGWYSDAKGYRYINRHPNGRAWPAIPNSILSIWNGFSDYGRAPECCLINYYQADAKMGLHQDNDEVDFNAPVVSVSLGDSALFRMGGQERRGPTRSIWLHSGDVVVMAGAARRAFHGIDRIKFGSSRMLKSGGRINLTLRVVR